MTELHYHPQLNSPVMQKGQEVHMPPLSLSSSRESRTGALSVAIHQRASIPRFLQHGAEGLMNQNTKLHIFMIKLINTN